jgi:hypothetical protein
MKESHHSPPLPADLSALIAEGKTFVEDEPQTPCPIDALDGLIAGSMAREVARVAAVPDALAVATVLGIASGAIGAGLRVQTYAGETGANLWFLAVARSGTGKDRCLNLAAEPLFALERDRLEAWRDDTVPDLEADLRIVKAELADLDKAIKGDSGPETKQAIKGAEKRRAEIEDTLVAEPCLTVADVTKEALAVTLSRQPGEAVFALSAEARGIMDIVAGRYSKCGDEDLWLAGFSGGAVKVNRIGRKPLALRNPRIAALLMIQPDSFNRVAGNPAMAESGYLPRFVLFDAKAKPQYARDQIEHVDAAIADKWAALIEGLVLTYRDNGEGVLVRLDDRAKRLLMDYANLLVDRRNGDLRDLDAFAARWAEIACRLSLVLHAIKHGVEAANVPISEDTASRAIRIVKWYSNETADLLGDLRESRRRERMEKLRNHLEGAEGGFMTLRDLERRHRFEREEVEAILPQIGGRIETKAGGKGRPSTIAILAKTPMP